MRKPLLLLIVLAGLTMVRPTHSQGRNTLDIYSIDVEGGGATLFVSPSGESLLVDAGNPGARDADRIAAAVKAAGLSQIDYLVISHYHGDHVGGVVDLAARVPIKTFVDHGSEIHDASAFRLKDPVFETYLGQRAKGRHLEVKPGDTIPVKGLNVTVVSADGAPIRTPLAGGGARTGCAPTSLPRMKISRRTRDRWASWCGWAGSACSTSGTSPGTRSGSWCARTISWARLTCT